MISGDIIHCPGARDTNQLVCQIISWLTPVCKCLSLCYEVDLRLSAPRGRNLSLSRTLQLLWSLYATRRRWTCCVSYTSHTSYRVICHYLRNHYIIISLARYRRHYFDVTLWSRRVSRIRFLLRFPLNRKKTFFVICRLSFPPSLSLFLSFILPNAGLARVNFGLYSSTTLTSTFLLR